MPSPPPLSLTLDLISIPVSNQDTALQFYTSVLTFKLLLDNRLNDSIRFIMLEAPGGHLRIALANWFATMPAGSMRGGVLACADLEATLAELERRGVNFEETEVMSAPWGRWKTFADPDGNRWIVQEHAKDQGAG